MFVANAEIRTVPMLPMREEVIFPGMTTPFFVGRKASMEALDRALSEDRHIFVVTQRNPNVESPKQSDLYEYGVLGKVLQVMRLPNGTVKALFEGEGQIVHHRPSRGVGPGVHFRTPHLYSDVNSPNGTS